MKTNDRVAFIHPSAGIMFGNVIDIDPQAGMVSVDVAGEPFFRRMPKWMLWAVPHVWADTPKWTVFHMDISGGKRRSCIGCLRDADRHDHSKCNRQMPDCREWACARGRQWVRHWCDGCPPPPPLDYYFSPRLYRGTP